MNVSIIITSYNYGYYIERCIRSCLDQRFPKNEFEVIVVDDQSNDETHEIIRNFTETPNFRFKVNSENLGVAGSANEGIKLSRGRFVTRVDADDYVSRDYIYFLSEYLKANKDAFCVACDYIYVNDFEEKIERVYAQEKPVSCGIMYRKDLLIQFGMYNSDWRHREEEELRKRVGLRYKIQHLRIPLYRYRMHKSNKTKQKDMMEIFKDKLDRVESPTGHINTETTIDFKAITEFVAAVIPARGGSKRLKRKNIFTLWEKPMIYWPIQAAKESKYIHEVYVSTEDDEIAKIAREYGATVIKRPYKLAEDGVYKQDVICHAVTEIESKYKKPNLVVSLQANSPEVKSSDLDNAITLLKKFKRQEVMSVDTSHSQNAAFRVMTYNTVFQKTLSTNFAVYVKDFIDIHSIGDIDKLNKKC